MPTAEPRRTTGSMPAVPAHPDAVRAYGKFLLVRKIAEGGMAEIFLAKQIGAEGFERNVVIKRMLPHLSESHHDFVNMFLDEARIAARLAHPNIVQINDLGQIDGSYFICMEYLGGEDFSTVVRTVSRRREYVPLQVAVRVLAEAAHGLHFAHEFTDEDGAPLNIVHRDISPSNIFVTYTGQVKVLDFGIAKAESRVTHTTAGVVKGKYMYMAPEQAAGRDVDRRADVFSLGVSLYEALTNVRPFAKDNDLAILNAVLKADFVPPRKLRPELPEDVEAVVMKSMHPKAELRYQTSGELAADLERVLGTSTSAMSSSQVASFMSGVFGEERMAQKTRIPSLASLAAAGVDIPGWSNPHSPKTEMAARERSVVTEGGSELALNAGKSKRKILLAVGAALLLLALGAGGLWAQSQLSASAAGELRASAVNPVQVVATPKAPVGEKDPVTDPPPDPSKALANPQPPIERPTHKTGSGLRQAPKGPLSGGEIEAVVRKHQGQMLKCFEENKEELPSDRGELAVQFTILGSGQVTNVGVKGPLAVGQAAACLKSRIGALNFRAHPDKEVSLSMPFQWRVEK